MKCTLCKKEFEKEELTTVSRKKYCSDCNVVREKEANDLKKLYKFICKFTGEPFPNQMILGQIKRYRKEMSIAEIYFTLKYFKEVQGQRLTGKGIGIVGFVHGEAMDYYKELKRKTESVEQADVEKTKVVHDVIVKRKRNKNENENKKKVLFDLED